MRIAEGYAEIGQKNNFAASQYCSCLNVPAMQKIPEWSEGGGFT